MSPVSVIEVKVCQCFELSSFVHSRYDEAEVVNYVFLVRVKNTSASSHHAVRSLVGRWLS